LNRKHDMADVGLAVILTGLVVFHVLGYLFVRLLYLFLGAVVWCRIMDTYQINDWPVLFQILACIIFSLVLVNLWVAGKKLFNAFVKHII